MAGEDTSLSGLAGRYALALLDLADEKKALDQVSDDLRSLRAAVLESDELGRFLRSPLYNRDQMAGVMSAVMEKVGVSDLTRRFVLVVAQNHRLFALVSIIDTYLAELARRRGEVTAHVTSARALSDQQRQSLTDALKSTVGANVQVDVEVDQSLIGGLIVRVGSRMIDSSLRTKLQRLQLAMKGVG
ncbi:MAG: F0F1 ATP synthase subunit delta [Pseudomonadota bacterium]